MTRGLGDFLEALLATKGTGEGGSARRGRAGGGGVGAKKGCVLLYKTILIYVNLVFILIGIFTSLS